VERITRRRVLAGGLATAAVGVAGGGVVVTRNLHGTRRFLHRHGLLDGPDRAAPAVHPSVEYSTLQSPTGPIEYGLYLPAGNVVAVLYCLHGRGGSRRDAFDGIGVHRFVAERGLPWGVASLDGAETFWHQRRNGSNTQRDLVDGLIPFVLTKAPGARAVVIGWSAGGFGALLACLHHPSSFVATVANAPSLWPTFSSATPGAFDDTADFDANDVLRAASQLSGRAVRVDCGEDDPFADSVRQLQRRAPSIEGRVRAGFHEDASWRSYLPEQLDFIQQHVG
jgi:pimeloyl-ACP methyl ester carboxylesterase